MPRPLTVPDSSVRSETAKLLGAFYTDAQVADFLVWWAVRGPQETVLDPSFGGGVFLRSACKRLLALGGQPAMQIHGAEIDPQVHSRIADKLTGEFGVVREHLQRADFFSLDPGTHQVDAVVGNPPFIRYQHFTGETRRQALAGAARQGVPLTKLSSSWAPFLVQSSAMLKEGGRLAMVVPFELGHAAYALPVLAYLVRSFGRVTLATFRKKLFPDLNEDTLLLLAEERGAPSSGLFWRDFSHAGELAAFGASSEFQVPGIQPLNTAALVEGRERLIEAFLPTKARALYRELRRLPTTRQLGELADVGIGYVTGANDYFHLGPETLRAWRIPEAFLRPAVRRGRSLTGLRFSQADWEQALSTGESGYLLQIEGEAELPESLRRYLREGQRQGVPLAYKCRTRSPWYRVPHVYHPDAFLTYMSGHTPRLVANEAGAVAPNSLHILRLHPETKLRPQALAVLGQTSLTQLSAEIEGHALGGGMLKVEPTEAERLLLPVPDHGNDNWGELAAELDGLTRKKEETAACERADQAILQDRLGLSRTDCQLLREAAGLLRERRQPRGMTS